MIPLPTELKYKSLTLEINQTICEFDPAKWVLTEGEVVTAPNKLIYDRKRQADSLEWKTTVEVQTGDTVIVDYHAVLQAFGKKVNPHEKQVVDPMWWKEGDDFYCVIRYDTIFARIRDGVVRPVNGHYIVKSIERPLNPRLMLLVKKVTADTGYESFMQEYGYEVDKYEVTHVCTPCDEYINNDYCDPIDGSVSVGDEVQVWKPSDKKYHVTDGSIFAVPWRGKERTYFVQGRWIMCVNLKEES